MRQNKILDYFTNRDNRSESSYSSAGGQQRAGGSGYGSVSERVSEPGERRRNSGRAYAAELTPREKRRAIAQETIQVITTGNLVLPSGEEFSVFDASLASSQATEFYPDDSEVLSNWEELIETAQEQSEAPLIPTDFGLYNCTTLSAAREMRARHPSTSSRIGILNFASATKPGGGFLSGAEAQEESIARSSSLFTSLTSPAALPFYSLHSSTKTDGFYTHSMIYSPGVVVFRDDTGQPIPPYTVDVVTSPAVNAGVVRQRLNYEEIERLIDSTMTERMARILFLFQSKGCKNIVLGSFGTGVFQNNISVVAATWAELLALPHSKFFAVFDRVEFAVLGQETYDTFRAAFEAKIQGLAVPGQPDN